MNKGVVNSKYNVEMERKIKEYVDMFVNQVMDVDSDVELIPSVSGLAVYLDVSRSTVYEWRKRYKAVSDTLERLQAVQETMLLNGGLGGRFNSNIAKLALANHGYSDKVDNISSDGSMSPVRSVAELSDEELEKIASEG